jgi:hypothetical protein
MDTGKRRKFFKCAKLLFLFVLLVLRHIGFTHFQDFLPVFLGLSNFLLQFRQFLFALLQTLAYYSFNVSILYFIKVCLVSIV